MPKTYEKADKETNAVVEETAKKNHAEIYAHGVRIDVIMAHPDLDDENKPKAPAIKMYGFGASAITNITSLKDRIMGRGDAEIILESSVWESSTPEARKGIIDHALSMIAVSKDKEGDLLIDAAGRPKLKKRKHDFLLALFKPVAERNGMNSPEVLAMAEIVKETNDLFFPFFNDPKLITEGKK